MADQDNRLGKARPVGLPGSRNDSLGATDLDDLYRFNLSGKSSLSLGLSGVKKANFDVEVYSFKVPLSQIPKKIKSLEFRKLKGNLNKYLQFVGASRKAGTAAESIQQELASGEYLVRVLRRKGNSKYRLNLTSTLIPPTDGGGTGGNNGNDPSLKGNSRETAYDTAIPTTTPITGTVSDSDRQDFHKFTLSQTGTFIFNASNFQGKADLQILDGSGNVVGTQTLDSTNPQNFEQSLGAGTFYLRIFQEAAGDSTSYSLSATTKSVPPPPTELPIEKTLATTGSTTIDGLVDNNDKQDDFKLTVSQAGDYLFNLTGLAGKADLQFFNSNQQQVTSTYTADTGKFIQPLDQGTYYLKVYQRSANTTSNYNLAVSLQKDEVGNTTANAFNVPTLDTEMTLIKRNYVVDGGKQSFVDYYKFNVPEFSKLNAELKGMFGDLGVRLVDTDNLDANLSQATVFNKPNKNTEVVIPGPLEAGDYILQVFAPTGQGSTYELHMSLTPTDGLPYISADVNSRPGQSSEAKNLVGVNNATFFVATDAENQTALYRTTGTIDKLKRIKVFDSVEDGVYATDDAFYFVGSANGSGNELWQVTDAGTVKQLTAFANSSIIVEKDEKQMAAVGDYLYFLADVNDAQGLKLRRASLSSATPSVDSSFSSNILAETTAELTVVNNTLFFVADDNSSDGELWRIQNAGTTATATPEKIGLNTQGSSNPLDITVVGDGTDNPALYLLATRGDGVRRLVKLSNLSGTIATDNMNLGTNTVSGDQRLFLYQGDSSITTDDVLYFTANLDGSPFNKELVKLTNPLAATTSSTVSVVADINSTSGSSISSFVEYNDQLYFLANDGTGLKIWYTNGTGANSIDTGLLDSADLTSGVPYTISSGSRLVAVGDTLYFAASSNIDTSVDPGVNTGLELWQVQNGTTMSMVQDINLTPDSNDPNLTLSSSPGQLAAIGGSLFFVASEQESGREVWSVTPI